MEVNSIFKNNDFEWINITSLSNEHIEQISEVLTIDSLLLEDCLDDDHLPKYEESNHVKFLLTRYSLPLSNQKYESEIVQATQSLGIFLMTDKLITIDKSINPIVKNVSKKIENKEIKIPSIENICLEICLEIMKDFNDKSILFQETIDNTEKEIFLKQVSSSVEVKKIYFLKRNINANYKTIQSSIDWVNAIGKLNIPKSQYTDLKDKYKDILSDFDRLINQCDGLLSMYLAISDQKNNEIMKFLAIYSAYFLPISFIAGFYGMNFKFMPELEHAQGYIATICIMIIVVIATFFYIRKKRM